MKMTLGKIMKWVKHKFKYRKVRSNDYKDTPILKIYFGGVIDIHPIDVYPDLKFNDEQVYWLAKLFLLLP